MSKCYYEEASFEYFSDKKLGINVKYTRIYSLIKHP